MKLRYLQLAHYPPLRDLSVMFSAASPLARTCSIRFVVGVNGSGKSHLLQALSEIFIALADWCPPHFPVTLVYELGREGKVNEHEGDATFLTHCKTIIVDAPGRPSEASMWVAEGYAFPEVATEEDFAATLKQLRESGQADQFRAVVPRGSWSSAGATAQRSYLPKQVLAYTTGDNKPWWGLWRRKASDEAFTEIPVIDRNAERPAGWRLGDEMAHQAEQAGKGDEKANAKLSSLRQLAETGYLSEPGKPWLLDSLKLKYALLAVVLPSAVAELDSLSTPSLAERRLREIREQGETLPGLRGLLGRAGWAWPVAVSLCLDFVELELWLAGRLRNVLAWLSRATQVLTEPAPSKGRTLWFDLGAKHQAEQVPEIVRQDNEHALRTSGAALLELLGGPETPPFQRFERLVEAFTAGRFTDLNILLRKADTDDILSFDELSDGEQMVLGRMALFHLLKDQDDVLLLLDEPETHFNDKWKREIVEIIDEAVGDTANEVFIATHSALTLTDVFSEEILLLEKDKTTGHAKRKPLPDDVHTFGATGDHPLRDVFGALDTVGQRSATILDVLLLACPNRKLVEKLWRLDTVTPDFQTLTEEFIVAVIAQEPLLEKDRIIDSINAIKQFAIRYGAPEPVRVIDAVERFAERVGPGYFQLNLYRALRMLRATEGGDAA
jgi:energy-coupling factor transporter ATP-binding protein EcfA2